MADFYANLFNDRQKTLTHWGYDAIKHRGLIAIYISEKTHSASFLLLDDHMNVPSMKFSFGHWNFKVQKPIPPLAENCFSTTATILFLDGNRFNL